MKLIRLLSLLLALCVCLTGCGLSRFLEAPAEPAAVQSEPVSGPVEPEPEPEPEPEAAPVKPTAEAPAADPEAVDVSALAPWDWDETALLSAIQTVEKLLDRGENWDLIAPAYKRVMDAYDEYSDISTLYSLAYDCDPSDQAARDAYYAFYDLDPYDDVCLLIADILDSGCASDFIAAAGNARLWDLEGYSVSDDETDALFDREQALVEEFDRLYYQMDDLEVELEGQTWSWNRLFENGDKLSNRDYNAVGAALEENENQQIGSVIVELVNLRNQIAALYGYDNYYELSWDANYYRDYTIQEYLKLRQCMISSMPALAEQMSQASYNQDSYYYGGDGYDWDISGFFSFAAQDEALPQDLRDAFSTFDSSNILLLPGAKGYNSGYMVELATWNLPVIYLYTYDSMYDLISLSHEAGHALNGYFCDESAFEWGYFGSIDVCEVQSGSTTLMLMDTLAAYRPDLADEIRLEALLYSVESLSWTVLDDDLERSLYENGPLTLEKANQLATQARRTLGLDQGSGFSDQYLLWVESEHLAAYPGYTVSYVTSSAAALGLWYESQTDPAQAWQDYEAVLNMPSTQTDFKELVSDCGLEFIYTKDFYEDLSLLIEDNYLPSGHSWK